MTQLLTVWEKQVQDCEQQSGDKISDAIKLGVVLHHFARCPELASVRQMAAEVRSSGHGKDDLVRSNANGSEHAREGCCLSRVREEGSPREGLLA